MFVAYRKSMKIRAISRAIYWGLDVREKMNPLPMKLWQIFPSFFFTLLLDTPGYAHLSGGEYALNYLQMHHSPWYQYKNKLSLHLPLINGVNEYEQKQCSMYIFWKNVY